jgi:medium-chain acyl-[acyl-carrier-protein] hydrolase
MTAPAQVQRTAHPSPVACRRRQPAAEVSLVAFAHAGGGPLTFQRWADGLAPRVELWHATLPGRAGRSREPFPREWPALVDELATAIVREVPTPIVLLGHSLGALLAFEVARRLTSAGVGPSHLLVSGCACPGSAVAMALPSTDDELLCRIELIYGRVPDPVRASQEVLDHFLPILRADLELARAYVLRPGVMLRCPITAMTGGADPIVPASELEGWRGLTRAGCELCVLPGGHFALLDHESAVLAKILSRPVR